MIPTAVATLAGALQIIDYALRFSRNFTAGESTALQAARAGLAQLDSTATRTQANEVIEAQVRSSVSAEGATYLLNHLAAFSRVTERFLREVRESEITGRLPQFGVAIEQAAVAASGELETWGCFDLWGHSCWFDQPRGLFRKSRPPVLRILKTYSVSNIENPHGPSILAGPWYFVQHQPLALQGIALVDVAAAHGYEPCIELYRARIFAHDQSNTAIRFSLHQSKFCRPEKRISPDDWETWTPEQMYRYFDAIVDDFLAYSHRVRSQIAEAQAHATAVRGRGRAD